MVSLILAGAMILSLAACGSTSESASTSGSASGSSDASADSSNGTVVDSEPTYGGSLTMIYGDELLQYFDPAMGDNRTYALWLESLWTIDWGSNDPDSYTSNYISYNDLQGQIAKDWSWDEDTGALTVDIRDDVYFQDKASAGLGDYDVFGGRQLKASDVAYSYDRLLGIDGVEATTNTEMPWSSLLPGIDKIDVVDDDTLVFYLTDHTEVALNAFMTTTVNITGPEWDTLTADQQNDWHYACGTGPYILTGFELQSSMDFTKSDNYYCYDERYPENKLPYLDGIKLVEISDSSNILTQFISGQLDIISFNNDLLNSNEIQQLKDSVGEDGYQEYDYETTPVGMVLHCNQSPFDDENVRIAIQEAIDVETITKSFYGESDYVLPGLWATNLGWDSTVDDDVMATYEYNPEDAKARLEEAGYSDGFEMTVYMKSDTTISSMFQMAAQYLAQVGITMNIETVSDTTELNSYATDESISCGYYSGVGGQYAIKFAQMNFFPDGPAYGMFNENSDWADLATQLTAATTLDQQKEIGVELTDLWMENHWCTYFTGCVTLHDFLSTKVGGYTGERFVSNNNTRTILPRIWSTTGE